MYRLISASIVLLISALATTTAFAVGPQPSETTAPRLSAATFKGLELRNLGPAFMSGRIADIALDPRDPSVWYVAVGSGGVWKTVNAGTTWTPVFDDQPVYSTGCVTVDPSNPNVVWVGAGENVGGRHVAIGDGVYRSDDGGASWRNVGLAASEHVSKIIVHPEDSDTVWVAAQGPLWSPGGDRGLYKTTDGGATWRKVLGAGEWTGVTDVVIDPRDPKVLYAATWQRHRTVAAYMGGGPESGVHRSTDAGETWQRLVNGLPEGDLGKIGLAISPQDPDVLYAAVELDRRTGGVWRSADRGASWTKKSDAVSGATGPHYYQELVASPHAFDRIYLLDFLIQVSDDGGATFRRLGERDKHVDNHALVFRADDPSYLLVGTDGGIYESFDLATTWRFVANLPVTQFYKVAVDDDTPFYNIYGGTQDNSSQGGPSRTDSSSGIRNSDWFIALGADGHQPATEPGNPDIVYCQTQVGGLHRFDRTTGETVFIQPQPEPGDPPERFNWDAPILVSPHSPTRLYFASQRVWRSDDRGDSWRPTSSDLTRDSDRMLLPLMGRLWSWDAPWDLDAMSRFGTITSLAESPLVEGLLYAGTDDGLIQVSGDGGASWRRIEVGTLPGVPPRAFVNDLKTDLHHPDTVYVALDNHKEGDFRPFLLKSTDRGRSWSSIAGDLPERHHVWRVVQDHVRPELLFAGTEYGVFFTLDGGRRWVELAGGVPTISFRDLAVQRRENDLVGATFGRGFFVLDDYTPLRELTEADLEKPALLFAPRRAWWYVERRPLGGSGRADQGAAYFIAPNPPFGAVLTYYLGEGLETRTKLRQARESKLRKAGKDTPRPPWDELVDEERAADPAVLLVIRDDRGEVVRRLSGPTGTGFHRVAWDLRHPSSAAVAAPPEDEWEDESERSGLLVAPGSYTATLEQRVEGVVNHLAGPVEIQVERLRDGALAGSDPAETAAFGRRLAAAQRSSTAAMAALDAAGERVRALAEALARSTVAPAEVDPELDALRLDLDALRRELTGRGPEAEIGEATVPSARGRLQVALRGSGRSTYGPTPTHRRSLELAEQQLADLTARLRVILEDRLPAFEASLDAAGVPWTLGRPLPPPR